MTFTPDHATIARFRTGRCKEALEDLFYQQVSKLEQIGDVDHKTVFIDGTKMESAAGRYPFCWWKSTEKQLAKVKALNLGYSSIIEFIRIPLMFHRLFAAFI